MEQKLSVDRQYKKWVVELKTRIRSALVKAAIAVDRELLDEQSGLAKETLKNPYNFDFLMLGKEGIERDSETEFRPEYPGKLNFYLNAVNARLRHPQGRRSIRILLCRTPKKVVVEYGE